MITDRKGDWIQTASGLAMWPLDPRPDEIDIKDIAAALSRQCRFAGHLRDEFDLYSVAEHSVRVSLLVESWAHGDMMDSDTQRKWMMARMWGLLHDASEAYLVDLPRPIKRSQGFADVYLEAEARLQAAICLKYLLPLEEPTVVKRADNVLLLTEKRDLIVTPPLAWGEAQAHDAMAQPLAERIVPWDTRTARQRFLNRFIELGGWLT